jgi:mannose-6-phosphate isomerase-like protein (cupin superfamily)
MKIRRVVTGITPDGRSVFASDSSVDGITLSALPGLEFHRLWGADEIPALPSAEDFRAGLPYFPRAPGFRFGLFTVPPDSTPPPEDIDVASVLSEMETKLPGLAAHRELDNPGMHTTDTVDYEYIVSGRVVLELDDGATVELGPGDTVIQNGTRHAWRNPFDEPCQMVVVLVGATRSAPSDPDAR